MPKNIWEKSEADKWFKRNKKALKGKIKVDDDKIIFLLNLYGIKPKSVIDIGAANGHRSANLHQIFKCKVTAVEPSLKAIKDGRKKFPFINFIHGTCDKIKLTKQFDFAMVNGVMALFYRETLLKSVAVIDNLVKPNGFLLIQDFGTDNYIKRKWHHVNDDSTFTWKMPYWDLFTKTGTYLEIAKLRFKYDKNLFLNTDFNQTNLWTMVLLKKTDNYLLTP